MKWLYLGQFLYRVFFWCEVQLKDTTLRHNIIYDGTVADIPDTYMKWSVRTVTVIDNKLVIEISDDD